MEKMKPKLTQGNIDFFTSEREKINNTRKLARGVQVIDESIREKLKDAGVPPYYARTTQTKPGAERRLNERWEHLRRYARDGYDLTGSEDLFKPLEPLEELK